MKRKVPKMTTDEEAEAFLEQDLSDLDFSQFKPVKFEFQAKAARLNMRLPVPLLDAVKASAKSARRSLHPVYPRGSGTGDSPETPPLNFSPALLQLSGPLRSTAYEAGPSAGKASLFVLLPGGRTNRCGGSSRSRWLEP